MKKELDGKEKGGNLDGGGQESPSSLNLAPTNGEDWLISIIKDFRLKCGITTEISRGAQPPQAAQGYHPSP
jgi:hypothetical protein